VRILDLYCGAGGAGMGYHRAGFDVTGVDLYPQPNYPFEFIQADAIHYLAEHWQEYDAFHASPPCQRWSAMSKCRPEIAEKYPDLIAPTRALLNLTGLPYVIENVQGSDVRRDLTLCGETFGLGVLRHRYFEVSGFDVVQPEHKPHRGRVAGWNHGRYHDGPYFAVYGEGGGKGTVAQWQQAMGIDWTSDRKELAEAIPPAYTEHIGLRLLRQIVTVSA